MLRPSTCVPIAIALVALMTGCDQQQPIAGKQPPPPGVKPGETPPLDPRQPTAEPSGGAAPLPPATAPTTPGVPNHPTAPEVPLPPPPASSPTGAPPPAPPTSDQGTEKTSSVPPPADGTATLRAPADTGRSDQGITAAVYRALTAQPGLSLDGTLITVNTQDGDVTLRGSVRNDAERDHIVAVVARVSGVRSVNNRLDRDGP